MMLDFLRLIGLFTCFWALLGMLFGLSLLESEYEIDLPEAVLYGPFMFVFVYKRMKHLIKNHIKTHKEKRQAVEGEKILRRILSEKNTRTI